MKSSKKKEIIKFLYEINDSILDIDISRNEISNNIIDFINWLENV